MTTPSSQEEAVRRIMADNQSAREVNSNRLSRLMSAVLTSDTEKADAILEDIIQGLGQEGREDDDPNGESEPTGG